MGANTLKMVQHPMSRPKTGLDAEELLVEGPGGVGGNLHTLLPPLLAVGLDGLGRGNGVAWEEVCLGEKSKEDRS